MTERPGPSDLDPLARVPAVRTRLGIGVLVVALIVVAGIVVLVQARAPHGSTTGVDGMTLRSVSTVAPGSTAIASARPSARVVLVHVLGAVRAPGLVQVRPGARVVDAIGAAGGLSGDADPAGINLARPLLDGEQVIVPRVGEAPPAPGAGQAAARGPDVAPLIDINTATAVELETLPRIGPAMSTRILAWRHKNGRFASVEDLMQVAGIGDATFDGLKDLVTV